MRHVYRKRGRAVRWENGTLVRVSESGVAIERDELFICHPDPELFEAVERHSTDEDGAVEETVRAIRVADGVRIERLIVSEGEAEHAYGDRSWRDNTRRLHIALARNHARVLLDLGDFDLDLVHDVAAALARAEEEEREAPPRLRLAPNVTAALLPSLAGVAPPNVTLVQRAGGVDGYGQPVEDAAGPWPNWYRPSYRVRPVRAPFHLTARCDVTEIDESRPIAIALLAPPGELALRVLVADGDRVYPSTVRIARIDAIGAPQRWFPYGAGVWGAELML